MPENSKSMYSWPEAKSKMNLEFKEIQKQIPDYDYSDNQRAIVTDEKVCDLLVGEIRELKSKMFDIIELFYELQRKENKDFQRMRDDLDIFSDEVKVRYCKFEGLTQEFLEKLIRHDFELITGLQKLNSDMDKLHKQAVKPKKPLSTESLQRQINDLVAVFKEREVICNIKEVSLSRTYKRAQEDIRKNV